MIDAAKSAAAAVGAASHHFQVFQCPMNLYESGAALVKNTGMHNGSTLLEEAIRIQEAVVARATSKDGGAEAGR